MRKRIYILFIALLFLTTRGKAQSYTLKSLEGKDSKISLFYKPASGTLRVSAMKDTLFIGDYMVVEQVKVLNNAFLSIEYVKRVGSNQHSMNLLFLYIDNGKLCQALHLNSLRNYDLRPSEYSSFVVKSTLIGTRAEAYKLKLNIHDENSAELTPKSNYKYDKIDFLAFDKKNYSFYNSFETMNGFYTLNDLDAGGNVKKTQKKYSKKDVPVIKIRDDKYYNIDHHWYNKNKTHFFSISL